MPERAASPASDSPARRERTPSNDDDSSDIPGLPDLSDLPVTGFTRRRMAFLGAGLLATWVVIAFARQVGDASAATARLEGLEASNTQLSGQVAGLEHEYQLIQRQEWISQQARSYGLGTEREIAFTLAPGAPALGADAPGSAAVRLGATTESPTPLESWLTLLFGPSR
jgi:cell division protein FtsB